MKETILIFEREATQNARALVDCVVALSQVSPCVHRTVCRLFARLFLPHG